MPLVLFHTRRVREALKTPSGLFADLIFLSFAAAAIGLIVMMAEQASTHISLNDVNRKTIISLSLFALPKYTLLSLGRGFSAYVLSLIFTLLYGTFAAHNHRAEKIMIPALDVLQAIPVLGFLPGLVLAMIRLFPTREIGLEIACIVMIFTAQVWNMTFSFHGSLRGIPQPLREVAAIQRLSGWQIFKILEVPAAMIGLVWNSMMSMAGGWFFLTVNEAFTLNGRDYRLPGIGSYMNEAILHFSPGVLSSWLPILGAIVAMVTMIVAVDQIFWRPIVVWSQRFRMDDIASSEESKSWMLDLLRRSQLYLKVSGIFDRKHSKEHRPAVATNDQAGPKTEPVLVATPARQEPAKTSPGTDRPGMVFLPMLKWFMLTILLAGSIWGAWEVIRLLLGLPLWDSAASKAGKPITEHEDWLAVVLALLASFLRTSTAVVIGAAWALPVGILIGRSRKWSSRLQPIIQVVASFPAPMLFPLVTMALVMLHIPFTGGCIALMLLGAQWYILFNVIAGASAIPQDLEEVGSVYRMSRWECWKQLYLPYTFPYLLTGLVTAAGGAWNATIVSEYVQLGDKPEDLHVAFGLGSTISKATTNGNFSLLAAGVVVMAVFVVLLNRFFWKRLYRLAEGKYSLNA